MSDKTLNIDVQVVYNWYDDEHVFEQNGNKEVIERAIENGDFKTFIKFFIACQNDLKFFFPSVATIIYQGQKIGHINIMNDLGFSMITENRYNGDRE